MRKNHQQEQTVTVTCSDNGKTNIAEVSNDSLYGCTTFMGITTNGIVTPNLTSYVSHTTSAIYYLNILVTYTGSATLQPDYWKFYAIRIA
jgi:hypothetical protein